MIELISLFLGLVVGPQTVEVSVAAEVAKVEIRLDGALRAEIGGPPWVASCDFGPELAPHRLEAIAFDAVGRELGRAGQLVNVPREMAEATLALEPVVRGEPRRARLSWRATEHREPIEIKVSFDGQPLEVGDPESIVLPTIDPENIHFLRVELTFTPTLQTQAELVIGGGFGEEVTQELTAVILTGTKRPPRPEQMNGWLQARGKPLRVAAVERAPLDLFVLREKSELLMGNMGNVGSLRQALVGGTPATRRRARSGGSLLVTPGSLTLKGESSLRFVFPSTRTYADHNTLMEIIPVSLNVADTVRGDFLTIVADYYFPFEDIPATEQRLADAVAVAGVRAAARGRPRAVILILAGDSRDTSRRQPAEVRKFLAQLQVPLYVWAPLEQTDPQALTGWGEVEDISTDRNLRKAIHQLRERLDEQWVIWVEGGYLPTEIELGAGAAGYELVGREAG